MHGSARPDILIWNFIHFQSLLLVLAIECGHTIFVIFSHHEFGQVVRWLHMLQDSRYHLKIILSLIDMDIISSFIFCTMTTGMTNHWLALFWLEVGCWFQESIWVYKTLKAYNAWWQWGEEGVGQCNEWKFNSISVFLYISYEQSISIVVNKGHTFHNWLFFLNDFSAKSSIPMIM